MAIFCQTDFSDVNILKFLFGPNYSRLACFYLADAVFVEFALYQSLLNDHHLLFIISLPAISIVGKLVVILDLVQYHLLPVYVPISFDLDLF